MRLFVAVLILIQFSFSATAADWIVLDQTSAPDKNRAMITTFDKSNSSGISLGCTPMEPSKTVLMVGPVAASDAGDEILDPLTGKFVTTLAFSTNGADDILVNALAVKSDKEIFYVIRASESSKSIQSITDMIHSGKQYVRVEVSKKLTFRFSLSGSSDAVNNIRKICRTEEYAIQAQTEAQGGFKNELSECMVLDRTAQSASAVRVGMQLLPNGTATDLRLITKAPSDVQLQFFSELKQALTTCFFKDSVRFGFEPFKTFEIDLDPTDLISRKPTDSGVASLSGSPMSSEEMTTLGSEVADCLSKVKDIKSEKNRFKIKILFAKDGRPFHFEDLTDYSVVKMTEGRRSVFMAMESQIFNCTSFSLPPDKYESWQEVQLNYDPLEMFE